MPKSPAGPQFAARRRWTTAEGKAVLAALARSGLSAAAFAAREGLDVNRLYRWRHKLGAAAAPTPPPAFIELPAHPREPVEIVLRSGRILRVSDAIEPGVLRRLVEALETPC